MQGQRQERLVCALIENDNGCVLFYRLGNDKKVRLPFFPIAAFHNQRARLDWELRQFFQQKVHVAEQPMSTGTHEVPTRGGSPVSVQIIVYNASVKGAHVPGAHQESVWISCPDQAALEATTAKIVEQLKADQYF